MYYGMLGILVQLSALGRDLCRAIVVTALTK